MSTTGRCRLDPPPLRRSRTTPHFYGYSPLGNRQSFAAAGGTTFGTIVEGIFSANTTLPRALRPRGSGTRLPSMRAGHLYDLGGRVGVGVGRQGSRLGGGSTFAVLSEGWCDKIQKCVTEGGLFLRLLAVQLVQLNSQTVRQNNPQWSGGGAFLFRAHVAEKAKHFLLVTHKLRGFSQYLATLGYCQDFPVSIWDYPPVSFLDNLENTEYSPVSPVSIPKILLHNTINGLVILTAIKSFFFSTCDNISRTRRWQLGNIASPPAPLCI